MVSAFNSSVNSGLVGLTFFALREYVASPALVYTLRWPTYTRRREMLRINAGGLATSLPYHATMSDLRTHKLLDTAIAGSATGSILNAWKRGLPGFIPGAMTAGVICTVGQFVWNELEVTRVKLVSRSKRQTLSEPDRPAERQKTFSEKLMDGLGVVIPIKKLSDEEYLQKLLKEREEVERRLEVVQEELELNRPKP